MKRLTRGAVVLAAALGVWGCSGDPTADLRGTPTTIATNPSRLFVGFGEPKEVLVQVLDEQGNTLPITDLTISGVPAGLSVVEDTAYLAVQNADNIMVAPNPRVTARLIVTPTAFQTSTFTIAASGLEKTLTVDATPNTVEATFSTITPALGEQVVLTAPAGTQFCENATVTFSGERPAEGQPPRPTPAPIIVSNTGTELTFIPGPNAASAATIDSLCLSYNPNVKFSVQTTAKLTTPVIDSIPVTFSNPAPQLNEAVTVTAGTGFIFSADARITVGGVPLIITGISADSTQVQAQVPFNVVPGPIQVDNGFRIAAAPAFQLSLPANDTPITGSATGTALAGTDAVATAPTIPLVGGGKSGGLTDVAGLTAAGTVGGTDFEQYYKVELTEETDFQATLTWNNGSDLGLFSLAADGVTAGPASLDAGGTGSPTMNSESGHITLPAGVTYLVPGMFVYTGSTVKPTALWIDLVPFVE